MTFTSFEFLLFFPVVVTLYYVLPRTLRLSLLFAASCFFYMAFVPEYILILFAVILIDFFLAKGMEHREGRIRTYFLIASVSANIGILFIFKYFNFFNENIALLADVLNWNYSIASLTLLLPIGLSFHIFQSISYVCEVYRKKVPVEHNLLTYATYVLFFPQMVAGPIERPQHLLAQLHGHIQFYLPNVLLGLRLMAWGFFKKIVIADRLAVAVDYVYGDVESATGPTLFLIMIFFGIQLYADFSGYSDIARGSARVLGIDVMRNFDRPYTARSIAEFWRRWHISLSTWFRDYVYYPLVYSRKRVTRGWLYTCILITFLATGLWHGAGWTFVIMGAIHGSAIVLDSMLKEVRQKVCAHSLYKRIKRGVDLLQMPLTFLLVCFSWIFFRAPNTHVAFDFISGLFSGWSMSFVDYVHTYVVYPYDTLGMDVYSVQIALGAVCVLVYVEYLQGKVSVHEYLSQKSLYTQVCLYTTLFFVTVLLGVYTTKQFIYFQF